jgi:peptide/nickel transport system permease protein
MTLRDAVRELLRNGPGRAGFFLLILLAALSVFVLVRFPRDFGERVWSDPARWADNPKSVPPAWSNLLTRHDRFSHRNALMEKPSLVEPGSTGESRTYSLDVAYGGGEPPTFASVSIERIAYAGAPPLITIALKRPEGREVVLHRVPVRGPRPDEQAPFVRFGDVPHRVSLSNEASAAQALADFFRSEYGDSPPPGDLRAVLAKALVSAPDPASPDGLRLLTGDYQLLTRVDVDSRNDTVAGVRFVLGGSVYGLMGTDKVGRDLAQGLAFGLPIALFIGIAASVLTTAIGAVLGTISGYLGGAVDMVIQRLSDVISNVPLLPLLIFLVFVFGSNLYLIMFLLVAFGWPGLAILIRTMVLQVRSGQLIEAAVALGAPRWRIMLRHVFPHTAPFVLAQMVFLAPAAILAESGLSFLGLGDPSMPTWGQILEQGFSTGAVFVGYWWWVIPPGVLIILTALVFMLLSLGLEPVVNPRLRRER